MSMFGIGLGGFMDGYQKMAESQRQDKRAAALDEQLKLEQKRASRQDVINSREDAEWQRDEDTRASIESIGKEAKATFDAKVATGEETPDNYSNFYRNYAVPQIQNTYLEKGEVDKAAAFKKWSESEDAIQGGKLAMGAMFKANNGDLEGALNDALQAGQVTGYIEHGYELVGHEKIQDQAGNALGFRVKVKGPDGNEVVQDIANADLPRMVATWLNPQAAFESRTASASAQTKRDQELEDYERKKVIDKKYAGSGGKARGDAIATLRKRLDGGLAGDETKFDDLPREDQEKMIREEQALQDGEIAPVAEQPGLGAPASEPRRLIVDKVTGQAVQPSAQQAPAVGPAQAEKAPAAIEKQAPADPKKSREENIRYMIEYANQALADKQDPIRIAEELQTQGVPRELWPKAVSVAVEQMQSKQIGLGR